MKGSVADCHVHHHEEEREDDFDWRSAYLSHVSLAVCVPPLIGLLFRQLLLLLVLHLDIAGHELLYFVFLFFLLESRDAESDTPVSFSVSFLPLAFWSQR